MKLGINQLVEGKEARNEKSVYAHMSAWGRREVALI